MTAVFDRELMDPDVRVQDDLFRHVNGGWLAAAEIPEDRSVAGAFITLRDESEKAVRAIVEEARDSAAAAGSLERKIGDLYASFMDEARREAAGVTPIQAGLDAVDEIDAPAALVTYMGECTRAGVSSPFGLYVINDAGNPERYVLHLYQGGLGLPDESYYREDKFADIVAAYEKHVHRMFELVGVDDPAGRAAAVLALETELAGHHWDVVTCRDPQKTYNLKTRAELEDLFALLPQWIDGLGAPPSAFDEVVVMQPDYLQSVGALLTSDRLAQWQDWLRWKIVHAAAPYLTAAVQAENFEFYGRTLSGTVTDRELWKRGVELVEDAMGEAVGALYVDRHFPPASKARMDELVANLVEAYRVDIGSLTWMSAETKQKALDKLAKFTPKIGYPDKWRDYSALAVDPEDVVGNVAAASRFELEYQLGKLGGPIDRTEWLMTPQTVNAYYLPVANEIVFPAAILQPPFFDPDADGALNYGGIGAVIGHEIGHGFDDKGSQYDGDGALRNWWTDADRDAFDEMTKNFIAQYDALEPAAIPGHHVNGALTVGENIGDLGGLTIAYAAYKISLGGAEPPVIDGLTGWQRLFYSWATIWRAKTRDEEAIKRLATDPHSPPEFRCNQIVRNLDEFYAAFGLEAGDGLWLDPGDRVRIW